MSRVIVAVVDSGWDRERGDARVLPGAAFLSGALDPDDGDRLGHGTACVAEVLRWAPDAYVLPARVFGDVPETTPEALVRAIRWATSAGAGVVSLSLGTRRDDARSQLEDACAAACHRGVIVVAAGPNDGSPTLPAALPGVVGVWPGRRLREGELRLIRTDGLDLEAFVGPRRVATLGGGTGTGDGTSLAAAEVAGRIARLLSQGVAAAPSELVRRLVGIEGPPPPTAPAP